MDVRSFYGRQKKKDGYAVLLPTDASGESEVSHSSDEDFVPNKTTGDQTDDSDDIPAEESEEAPVIPTSSKAKKKQPRRRVLWKESKEILMTSPAFIPPHTTAAVSTIKSSYDYFLQFFSKELIEYVCEQTNLYSIQKNPNKPIGTTGVEMEQFLGMVIMTSLIKVPSARDYWSAKFRVDYIADIMPVNRFESIRPVLHLNDNSKMIADRASAAYDPIYKIQPIMGKYFECMHQSGQTRND